MKVAIVDYGMGNLFNILRACEAVGLEARITQDPAELRRAASVILPGVGAFGDAMEELRARHLVEPLRELAADGRPFLGICLGLQLVMEQSEEFGRHEGLGIVPGKVVKFEHPMEDGVPLKIPQVGWNGVHRPSGRVDAWKGTPLEAVADGVPMYFVHSYYAIPTDRSVVTSYSRYGQIEFCSSLRSGNLFCCQFHPERSGETGLEVYRWLSRKIG